MLSAPEAPTRFRFYVVLRTTPHLLPFYEPDAPARLLAFTRNDLLKALGASPALVEGIRVAAAPSLDWSLEVVGEHPPVPTPDKLIIVYEFPAPALLREFRELVLAHQGKPFDANGNTIVASGADPGGGRADHWCPGRANSAAFGDRADARRLIGADALGANGLTGCRVNVVIIDEGLDKALLPAKNWGGGIAYQGRHPGMADRTSHGVLIARNVLNLAPDAVLYDVPLIPPRITNVPVFASDANVIYEAMQLVIPLLRALPRWSGPWVVSNAWAIFDRASEGLLLGDYTENLHPGGHPLNNTVGAFVLGTVVDVVFAAGNCGEFCPSRRCGPVDRGPGHSIWGANAHPAVITSGAVRTDETWLGYSSQGPGPMKLATQKPDLCAPSNFTETLDAHAQNTGTSASSALLVGTVAALRSNPKWDSVGVPPNTLKQALIATTRKTHGAAWGDRLGNGVLDVAAAVAKLSAAFP